MPIPNPDPSEEKGPISYRPSQNLETLFEDKNHNIDRFGMREDGGGWGVEDSDTEYNEDDEYAEYG